MTENARKDSFTQFLQYLAQQHKLVNEEFKYIGLGNPFSDILIIGKESSIAKDLNPKQYHEEIVQNCKYWSELIDYDIDKLPERQFEKFSSLYPYKGQILKRDNGRNFGTSVTWMNYQKLYNYIYGFTENQKINFHENTFITEVNSSPSRKTKDANISSITYRKTHVFSSDYFRSFPIVIISGVGYFEISENTNEIEEIFGVKFSEKKFVENERQPYWIHFNDDRTKIVINTYQLSIGISDNLLRSIAVEIQNSRLLTKSQHTTASITSIP